ncbi:MAG: MurR/RpiR family transcriptional regulator [Erysipelotrichia bacterium]|nr:MurR/RpiR family transcriptional regulator [Erysipelotrichia bacterium]
MISIEEKIKSCSGFTKSEKLLARYVTGNLDQIYLQTLSELAANAGVGQATVLRFIEKLGYSNFGAFKIDAAKDSALVSQKSVSANTVLNSIEKETCEFISAASSSNPQAEFDSFADLLYNANHIYFYGVGTSGNITDIVAYKFLRDGLCCKSVTDAHKMIVTACTVTVNDLIVLCSYSGETVELIRAVNIAKENSCRIALVTAFRNSSLEKLSDLTLYIPADKDAFYYYGASMQTIITNLYVFDCLLQTYYKKHSAKTKKINDKLAKVFADHYEKVSE